ncbi:hypothetical protein AB0I68_30505 [Streptomyces sp. NPDC050448]|uniref:hypothetical protein n=1 Tax=Streptomyces sp. NPDC050448 TaxID=3155404 RepID=UPI00343CE687
MDHQSAIKDAYGYRTSTVLVGNKMLVPGTTVLEGHGRVHPRARQPHKMRRNLTSKPNATQRTALTALLPVKDSRHTSTPGQLCRPRADIIRPRASKAIDRSIEFTNSASPLGT